MPKFSFLNAVESVGNRLPHPTLLFIYLCALVLVLSAVASAVEWQVVHPVTSKVITAVNLMNQDGLQRLLTQSITNFTHFAPVGSVLVAMMGLGVAEHSGLLSAALRALVLKTPAKLLTFTVVLTGVLSSIAMDVGYVVLIPLAAVMFKLAGRNPILGITAAFAGVSGGFSANLLLGPVDYMLSGISTESAQLIDASAKVSISANYYFMVFSTIFISLLGTWVTDNIVAKRVPAYSSVDNVDSTSLTDQEVKGLRGVGIFSAVFLGVLLAGLIPEQGILRDAETHSISSSPFIHGIVVIIAFYTLVSGIIFGRLSASYSKVSDFITGMENSVASMASYLVLMFFAAQFVSLFAWSQLGSLLAINGAGVLSALDLPRGVLLVIVIIAVALVNLFIGSSSAKWSLLAPVLVPMLMLLGVAPETTQVAYRVGDSCTNIITPLMPYFGVIIAFAQQHQKDVGLGTLAALMLPYSLCFMVGWSVVLLVWVGLGMPLGF